jgi:hypothetical protein
MLLRLWESLATVSFWWNRPHPCKFATLVPAMNSSLRFRVLLLLLAQCISPSQAQAGRIIGFRLVRAPSGTFVTDLVDGAIFYLNGTKPSYTIVAVPDPSSAKSIRTVLYGWNSKSRYRTEKIAPYTLCGGRSYNVCKSLKAGVHTVTATPNGGAPFRIAFTIVAGFPPPTLAPVAVPTPTLAPIRSPMAAITSPSKAPIQSDPLTASPVTRAPLAPPVLLPTVAPTYPAIRINCGGPLYTDVARNQWLADVYFTNGTIGNTSSSKDISNTVDDDLYRTFRSGAMQYLIPVPNGLYEVHLLMAETTYVCVLLIFWVLCIRWCTLSQCVCSHFPVGRKPISESLMQSSRARRE